jgi:hypothetical protein
MDDIEAVALKAARWVTPLQPSGIHPDDIVGRHCITPWFRGEWNGRCVQLDPAAQVIDVCESDVSLLLAYGETPDTWDGEIAGIALLRNKTFLAWGTFYGPTGHGFSRDAYGGDADMMFASTWERAWLFGLTDKGRELVRLYY